MGFVISDVIVFIVFVDLRKAVHYLMLCYMSITFVYLGFCVFWQCIISKETHCTGQGNRKFFGAYIYLSVWLFVHPKCSSVGLLHDLGGSNTKKK